MKRLSAGVFLLLMSFGAHSQQPPPKDATPGQQQQEQPQTSQQAPATTQRGTEQAPIVVKVLPTPKTETEAAQEAQERVQRATNEQQLIQFNRWLIIIGAAQLVVFTGQLLVFWYQALKLRQTVRAAADQSGEMKKSVGESARAASAMEEVAEAVAISAKAATESVANIKDVTARQLRAYLVANFGAVVPQDRNANYHFGVRILLVNTGNTPAYNTSFKAKADIVPFPLPDDFSFTLPETPVASASTLGPHQNFIMSGILDRMVSDEEITEISTGPNKRLFIWGTATYEDAFGIQRYTNFCQAVIWLKGGQFMGHYTKRHNDAN